MSCEQQKQAVLDADAALTEATDSRAAAREAETEATAALESAQAAVAASEAEVREKGTALNDATAAYTQCRIDS